MSAPGLPSIAATNASSDVSSEWRASWQYRLITILLAGLCLGFPGALMMGVARSSETGVQVAGGIMLFISVALIAFIWWQQSGVRILVSAGGVEYIGRINKKKVLWNELGSFVYIPQQRRSGYYGGGLVGLAIAVAVEAASSGQQLGPGAFVLIGRNGQRIKVNAGIGNYKDLINRLIPLASSALFPAIQAEFDAGRPVRFGQRLTVTRSQGVSWKGFFGGEKSLAFNAIAATQMLEGQSFVLRTPGKTFPWLRVAMAQVPNLFALIQLLNYARTPNPMQAVPVSNPVGAGNLPGSFSN